MRLQSAQFCGNCFDVIRRASAATAGDVQPSIRRKIVQVGGHRFRRFVESAKGVGKSGVRMAADGDGSEVRKLLDVRAHLFSAKRAVDTHAEQIHVRNGNPERFNRLPGKGAPALIRDGDGHHDRHAPSSGCKILVVILADGEERGFRVQRVKNGFHEQQEIHAALDEAARLLIVDFAQFVERHAARSRTVHILRHGRGAIGRPHRSSYKFNCAGIRRFVFVGHFARDSSLPPRLLRGRGLRGRNRARKFHSH